MKKDISVFFTGWLQVTLVSANVSMIANHKWFLAFLTSWMLSFIWTLNVKKAAFGKWKMRIIYATGAAFGCMSGMFLGYLCN